MSVVDLGTLFHAAVIVGEGAGPPSSGDMARALQMIWLSWAGPPETIVLDRGLENRGQLQKLVSAHGVLLRYVGVESPHQLGRGERQGGILKDIMRSIVMSRQLRGRQNMEFVLTESVAIKNHRINHNGFSPESLTTLYPEAKLGVHQEILDGETSFAQQMMIRGAAKEAFAQVDSSQRIRAAMLRKSVPSRGPFVMGDLVCFHRRQGGRAGWKWFGPARVIGQEGRSTLWVVHGGIPMTVSSEQCRHATANEMMAKRILELKPSRKRRREDMEGDGREGEDDELPFHDDLIGVGGPDGNQQTGFFDMGESLSDYVPSPDEPANQNGQERSEPHAPPPGLESPRHIEMEIGPLADQNGQERSEPHASPPGLSLREAVPARRVLSPSGIQAPVSGSSTSPTPSGQYQTAVPKRLLSPVWSPNRRSCPKADKRVDQRLNSPLRFLDLRFNSPLSFRVLCGDLSLPWMDTLSGTDRGHREG